MAKGPEGSSSPGESRPRGLYGQRPSESHDDFRRREFLRIAAMTARGRMLEALSLGEEDEAILRPPGGGETGGEGLRGGPR